jgi:hypothetical protein
MQLNELILRSAMLRQQTEATRLTSQRLCAESAKARARRCIVDGCSCRDDGEEARLRKAIADLFSAAT